MPSQQLDTQGHANVDEREKIAFDYDGFLIDTFEDAAALHIEDQEHELERGQEE